MRAWAAQVAILPPLERQVAIEAERTALQRLVASPKAMI